MDSTKRKARAELQDQHERPDTTARPAWRVSFMKYFLYCKGVTAIFHFYKPSPGGNRNRITNSTPFKKSSDF